MPLEARPSFLHLGQKVTRGGYSRSGGTVNVVGHVSAGRVMSIEEFDDETLEFWQVHKVFGQRRFGKNGDEPPLCVQFDNNQARDKARRDFGPGCLNCGVETHFHFARDCKEQFMNASGLLHLDLAKGDPATVERNFRPWQQRLTSWVERIRSQREGSRSRSPSRQKGPWRGKQAPCR